MHWIDMPPLAALRAFAAFAETGNVSRAGAMLNVSHAAISQQLRALEQHLGLTLLDRSGRSMTLTAEGAQLAGALGQGFGLIRTAVAELTGAEADRPLHVTTTPTFAASWLMPRLPDFRARHPEIDIMLDPSASLCPLEPGGVDVALRYGSGDWPDLEATELVQSPMVVVAAPSLLAGRAITAPADLTQLPWLEELGTTEATRWLSDRGHIRGPGTGTTQVPGNLLLDGARDGQGVAVTVRYFVEADLASGRLVCLFEEHDKKGYFTVTRKGPLRPPVKAFVAWLRRQNRTI